MKRNLAVTLMLMLASTISSTSLHEEVEQSERSLISSDFAAKVTCTGKRARPNSQTDLDCSFSHYQTLLEIINISTKRERINAYKSNIDLVTAFLPHLDIQSAFHIK